MANNNTQVCSRSKCTRSLYSLGVCKTHYRNERARALVPDEPDKQCRRDGCVRIRLARGLCRNHYYAQQRQLPAQGNQAGCQVDGCRTRRWARGYCLSHYQRWTRQQRNAWIEEKLKEMQERQSCKS